MNINTREGDVYLAGQKLEGEERDTYLGRAAQMWKGETYWFLMPYKLHDPGVVLSCEGEETADGATIRMEDIVVTDTMPDEVFTVP